MGGSAIITQVDSSGEAGHTMLGQMRRRWATQSAVRRTSRLSVWFSGVASIVLAATVILAPTTAAAQRSPAVQPSPSPAPASETRAPLPVRQPQPASQPAPAGQPASRPLRSPRAVSAFESFYNPFGDPWASRTTPNPSIPVALTPACSRYGPKAGDVSPRPEEIQFMATSNSPLLWEECSFLIDAENGVGDQRQKDYITALKAARPSLKYLAFFEPAGAYFNQNSPPPYHVGATDIEASHPEWLVYIDGQVPSPATRVKHRGFDNVFLYDITNPAFRAFMVQRAVTSMNVHGIDGVVIDQCSDYPLFEASTPPSSAFINAFDEGCIDFLRELKLAIGPNRLVLFLSYASLKGIIENRSEDEKDAMAYEFYRRRADVADGLIWEDPLGGARDIPVNPPSEVDRKFTRFRQVQEYATSRDGYIGLATNTNIQNQSTFGSTNADEQHLFAKYYVAAYLTQFRGEKSLMLYYTPSEIGEQFRSAASFNDWNVDVGAPTGPPATRDPSGEGRYQRNFTRARVFLNGGNSPWQVTLTDRLYTSVEGQAVTGATIAPRSGVIFLAPDLSATCAAPGRPKVAITTTRGAPGTLQVNVKAGLGFLQSIQFVAAQNAVIDLPGGPTGTPGGFTFTPPANATEVTFTVRRTAAAGVTVPFTVQDACGPWQTFVGGGPNAF